MKLHPYLEEVVKPRLLSTGGVTFHYWEHKTYEEGFQVALYQPFVIMYGKSEVDKMLTEVWDKYPDAGIWFDGEDYVVDAVTVHISDFDDAMRVASHNGQHYIYNWQYKEEVKVRG